MLQTTEKLISMSRVFSSNPYNWFFTFIAINLIIIIGMLYVFDFPIILLAAIIIGLALGYFVIPSQMNFKAILEINKDGIIFYNEKLNINWEDVIEVHKENERYVLIEVKSQDGVMNIEEIDCNKIYNSAEDIIKLIEKYNQN